MGRWEARPTIEALVFDFDGLMVDTETPAYESWLEVYRAYAQEFPFARWSAGLGGSGREFDAAAYLAEQIGQPDAAGEIARRRRHRKHELAALQPLLPGVMTYLDDAARLGVRVGVASSSSRAWVVGHLERLGVADRFDVIMTADEVERVKPAPDLYQAAVAALGVLPVRAVALEDAPSGLLSAKRAGLLAVAVPNPLTDRLPLDHADVRIASLAAVPLERLLRLLREVQCVTEGDEERR